VLLSRFANKMGKVSTHNLSEELLCVLPVIDLDISPSKSVEAAAYHVVSRFAWLLLGLPNSC
jgi:hypothetical protein